MDETFAIFRLKSDLEEQLNSLSGELEQAQTALNVLQDEHNALMAAHSEDTDLLRGLREELADRRASRDGFALQRDDLMAERDNLLLERDKLAQENHQLQAQLQDSQAQADAQISALQQQCSEFKVPHWR